MEGQLLFVPIDDVIPNDYNPNSMNTEILEKERKSLIVFGMVRPIITRREGGKHIIIDGEHRWRLLKDEGVETIPIRDLGEISNENAMALTVSVNGIHGNPEYIKLIELVGGIRAYSATEIASVTPWSDSEIKSFIDMSSLGGVGGVVLEQEAAATDDRCIKFTIKIPKEDVDEFSRKADRLCQKYGLGIDDKEKPDVKLGRLLVFLMRQKEAIFAPAN